MPLPNTRVIPAAWSAHHAPAAEAGMTATCTITRPNPSAGTLDTATGVYTDAAPTTVATGIPCRVQTPGRFPRRNWPQAAPDVTRQGYLVAVPNSTPVVHVDDLVTIDTATGTALVGVVLRVIDVTEGSEVWQRDLTCVIET